MCSHRQHSSALIKTLTKTGFVHFAALGPSKQRSTTARFAAIKAESAI